MNLVPDNIPGLWLPFLWLGAALLGIATARGAQWRRLLDRNDLNVFLGATVAVLALWFIKTGIKPGLSFHLLGATGLTLMFGPWFALLALGLLNALTAAFSGHLAAWPANWLINGAVPVAVSWGMYQLVDRKLPNHFFIYIFLNAFFGAALAIGVLGAASTLFDAAIGAYPLAYLLDEYLPYYMLMAWGEAFATGMLITLMVVYKPEWVSTFDDTRYLGRGPGA